MFGLGKKTKTEAEDAAYARGHKDGKRDSDEKSVAAISDLKLSHKNEVSKLKAKIEDLENEVEAALQKSGSSKTKIDNSPLTDKDKKKITKTRAKLLDSLESIVRGSGAQSIRGASIVKEGGDIKVLEINSKDEALTLISRAKNGEVKIIM